MPKDQADKLVDFYGRSFYKTTGYDASGEFKLQDWHAPGSAVESRVIRQYGPKDTSPLEDWPHLVGSWIDSGSDNHAPALDIDFHLVQKELVQLDTTESLQAVQFTCPRYLTPTDFAVLRRVLTRDLHLADEVQYQRFSASGETDVVIHFHPATRIHVVKSTHHNHLYINRTMKWEDYEYLLLALAECGIVSSNYCDFSIMRHQSFLRYPGISKRHLPSPSSEATATIMVDGVVKKVPPMVAANMNQSPFNPHAVPTAPLSQAPRSYMPSRS